MVLFDSVFHDSGFEFDVKGLLTRGSGVFLACHFFGQIVNIVISGLYGSLSDIVSRKCLKVAQVILSFFLL